MKRKRIYDDLLEEFVDKLENDPQFEGRKDLVAAHMQHIHGAHPDLIGIAPRSFAGKMGQRYNEYNQLNRIENVRYKKQVQKQQDLNRIKNKTFRENARLDNALQEINTELVSLLKEHNLSNLTKRRKPFQEKKGLIVHLTDMHFNELINLDINKYDFKVAAKRLEKFAFKVKRECEFEKINQVLIAFTGDGINSDRRLDEKLVMATNRTRALWLAIDLLQLFIRDINQVANVDFAYVIGNESRITENNGWVDMVASDNYDYSIYEGLKRLFAGSRSVRFVDGDIVESVVSIAGQNVLLIHGHQLAKDKEKSADRLIRKYAQKDVKIDLIVCGHLHHTVLMDYICQAGSLCGANDYSDKALLLNGKATQGIYKITETGSDKISIDLQNTDNFDGYDIDMTLATYNVKSADKLNRKTTVFEVRI